MPRDPFPIRVAVDARPPTNLVPRGATRDVEVRVWGQGRTKVKGVLELTGASDWTIEPRSQRFTLDSDGLPVYERFTIVVTAPDDAAVLAPQTIDATAIADKSNGDDQAQAATSITVEAVWRGDTVPLALDAGTPDSPVLEGYAPLTPEHTWDPTRGYGWLDPVPAARDRGEPDVLRRDLLFSAEVCTLRIVVPPGEHRAHLLTGDAHFQSSHTVVYVGGERVAKTDRFLEAGEFAWLTFTLDGGDSGRTVDITLDGEGHEEYWRLGALVVTEAPSGS
ncbi:MAG TPA: hypothetical protein VIL34_17245 [Actinopolymorphaceae bacterium]